jgi:hypothetical protein
LTKHGAGGYALHAAGAGNEDASEADQFGALANTRSVCSLHMLHASHYWIIYWIIASLHSKRKGSCLLPASHARAFS